MALSSCTEPQTIIFALVCLSLAVLHPFILNRCVTDLLGCALNLLHQVAHEAAARGLAFALLLPAPILLPIVPVRVILQARCELHSNVRPCQMYKRSSGQAGTGASQWLP